MRLLPGMKFTGSPFCRFAALLCAAGLVFTCGCHQKTERETFVEYQAKAKKSDRAAQYTLGAFYFVGQGVERDYAEAVKWYRRAADQNLVSAQISLGYCYEHGQGVDQDVTEAVKWFRKAAEQNSAGAQYALGKHYAEGTGVEKDYVEAYAWFNLAVKNYGPEAKNPAKNHEELETEMSPHQIAAGNKRTRELRAQIAAGRKSIDK